MPRTNSYFTRDPSAWICGGVVVNPMYWPARRLEALNVEAVYRFHPLFRDAGFDFRYSREQEGEDFGRASSEGGDIMPSGNRTVAIGMSERATGQMIEKIAHSLFAAGAADRVIAAGMSRDRAHMHLDTVPPSNWHRFRYPLRHVVSLRRAARRTTTTLRTSSMR